MRNRHTAQLSVIVALASVGAALVVASTAGAAPPTIERTLVDFTFVDSVDCAFPVEVHIEGTDTAITTIVQGDVHEFHAFGGGFTTLTNLDSEHEKSITFNISGPGRFTFGADGSFRLVGTGTALFAEEATPGIQWFMGRWDLSIDAEGNETFTTAGVFKDMCAALAD